MSKIEDYAFEVYGEEYFVEDELEYIGGENE